MAGYLEAWRRAAKYGVSRRAFLAGLTGTAGAAVAPRLALAQTTSEDALEGEALEIDGPRYTLVAKYATYPLRLEYGEDTDGKLNPFGAIIKTGEFQYKTRTWAENGVVDANFLGPVLIVEPGQTFQITVRNEFFGEGEYADLGPPEPTPESWLFLLNPTNDHIQGLHKTDPIGFPVYGNGTDKTPLDDFYIDWVNIPKNYDFTNLHLHGMQVTPHLFDPEGTQDPQADYITIKPGEERVYTFTLPEDHPTGTFWYHPHRHNSVAIQAWSGMAGMLIVKGTFDVELASYGVKTMIPFAVHDPHYTFDSFPKDGKAGVARVAPFLADQNVYVNYTFMVTGRYRPEYTVKKNEIVHVRQLIATIENLTGFRIVKREGEEPGTPAATDAGNLPFYIAGSDGIAYEKPVERDLMVAAGGERHDILLQFPEPGTYDIWSDNLGAIQYFGTGPKDQLLASFHVIDEEVTGQTPIDQMTFTPGVAKANAITRQDVMRLRHLVFDVDTNTRRIPFPQMKINDRNYRPDDAWFDVKADDTEEWVIMNPTSGVHPFHIHVVPFQVVELECGLTIDDALVPEDRREMVQRRIAEFTRIDHPGMWRDTIMIPSKGLLRLRIRFPEHLTGKTVFHCHFLAHEETGMLQNFVIRKNDGDKPEDR